MQTQNSKGVGGGTSKSNASKSKQGVGAGQSSRNRDTSGGDSGGGTGRTLIFCDKKNVTPKSLVPAGPHGKDVKSDAVDELGVIKEAGDAHGVGTSGEEVAPVVQPPPVLDKAKPTRPAGLTKEELDRNVDIILTETDTNTILNLTSLCVALVESTGDNEKSSAVSARNKAYEELCDSKADSDQYRDQHAQTLNHPHKSKEVLAAPPSQESVEVNANRWDIYDTFATDPVPKHEQIQQACERESAATVAQAVKKPGCLFNMNEPHPSADAPKEATGGKKPGGKSGAGAAKGAIAAGASVGSGGLGGGTSKPLAAGASGGLAAGGSGQAGGLAAGSSGQAGEEEGGSPTARAGSTSPGPGAEGGAASGAEDATVAEEMSAEPVDPIPWKVGAANPIPEELSQALRTMERIVSQNVFHKQHMIYRNYPTLEELAKLDAERADEANGVDAASDSGRRSLRGGPDAEGDAGGEEGAVEAEAFGETSREDRDSDNPYLEDLFSFDAPQLTQGMTVTCAEWNSNNKDLLAVSYGDTAPVPNAQGGLVLFWSLKNPTYPERVIRTKNGVTALHFSSVHPNMVAAGTHDGSVMIWDLRRPTDIPVLRSGSAGGNDQVKKHTDIVWETRWVDRGPDKQPQELLVSVSSDGNVFQWSMKKGLEQTVLMNLKRLPNPHLGSNSVYGHKEGIVFRKSSGFCVDFPRHDPSTYLVGTEDGLVHRCSTSYNEQYLDTYYGHSGPVYKVRCNPYASHAFLTCSADWTMKLWTTKPPPGHPGDSPLLTFQSTDLSDAVNDVIWAPHNSTSFAAAMDDGRVELWDLSERPLDPIVVHYPRAHENNKRRFTCVRFSPNSPVLVAGDDQGSVDVMRMYNTNQSYYSDQEQQDRLNAVMTKKR